MIDTKKLNKWAKEIHDNATAHGWHEEKHSPEHYLALVMCEVAEAVEADRKGLLYSKTKVCYATDSSFYDNLKTERNDRQEMPQMLEPKFSDK